MDLNKKYTNRLIDETSPYLLQHAHNPVDWYPWSEEAFERAKAEDKPVLVSIGYSACHWCHVMEHESFEDEAVAAIQNEHFVNIKVDMEERPDVDQIYMSFVQVTTGRGGWPMNVFLTPEKLPFFGGTYFPPHPRYGMPSWQQILLSIAEAWNERRAELLHSANEIIGELRRMSAPSVIGGSLAPIDDAISDLAFESFARTFDARNGGFGGAPKFPPSMSLEFLLRYWKRTANENALEMVAKTAEKMACGGIYDQLGGGFHRYSVDAVWLVPHFEKMLYDNAQLIRIYLHLYQIYADRNPEKAGLFKRIAVETLEYVLREMTDAKGGFYSSQDADSEGEEGKFFVWTPEEVVEILGKEAAAEFCKYYDITSEGNFEGKNILNIKEPSYTASSIQLRQNIQNEKQKLFEHRESRVKPFRDEKVLTAWNGLMLAAFAEAAAIFDDQRFLQAAVKNADFLLGELVHDGRVLRSWKDGKAKLYGYIEDYANLADGLLELYQISGDTVYLRSARDLTDRMISDFWDEENGGFFFTSHDHEELIVRSKDLYDNATPSGNSVAADVMLRLAKFYGEEKYERFASTILRLSAEQIRRFPNGFGRSLSTAEFMFADVQELALIGRRGNDLERELWKDYRPFKVVAVSEEGVSEPPLMRGRELMNGEPTAYVCEGFVCKRPVTTVEEFRELLK